MVFCKLLEDWSVDLTHFTGAKVPQTCWDLTADLCYAPLVVFYPPEVVAASVLYIALQLKTVRVIEEKEGKRWFEVCRLSHAFVHSLRFFYHYSASQSFDISHLSYFESQFSISYFPSLCFVCSKGKTFAKITKKSRKTLSLCPPN